MKHHRKAALQTSRLFTITCLLCTFFQALSTHALEAPQPVLQTGHEQYISALAIAPDGQSFAAGDYGGHVKIWTHPGNEALHSWQPSVGRIRQLQFSPDGQKLLVDSESDGISLWATHSGARLWDKISGNSNLIAWTPDSSRLVLYGLHRSYASRIVWDAVTGTEIKRTPFRGYFRPGEYQVLSPSGRVLASDGWPRTRDEISVPPPRGVLIDGITGKVLRRLEDVVQSSIRALAFSPDEKVVAVGGKKSDERGNNEIFVQLFDVATGKKLREWKVYDGANSSVEGIVFSSDGKTLVTTGHDGVGHKQVSALKIWDMQSGKLLRKPSGEKSKRRSLPRFAPDGKTLFYMVMENHEMMENHDIFVQSWNLENNRIARTPLASHARLNTPNFSPDGKYLIAGSGVRLSPLESPATLRFFDLHNSRWKTPPWGTGKLVTQEPALLNGKPAIAIHYALGANLNLWAFSRDGSTLVVAPSLHAWHWPDGKMRADAFKDRYAALRATGFQGVIQSLNVAPDNHTVALATIHSSAPFASAFPAPPGGCVALWDMETNAIEVLRTRVDARRIAFSPDGKTLAVLVDELPNDPRNNNEQDIQDWHASWRSYRRVNAVEVWDVASRKLIARCELGQKGINFTWLDNGRLLLALVSPLSSTESSTDSDFHELTAWNFRSGQTADFRKAEFPQQGVVVSLTSQAVGIARAEEVLWFALPDGRALGRTPIRKPYWQRTWSLAPDARFAVSAREARTLEFWDLKDASKIASFALLPNGNTDAQPNWIAWTPSGTFDGSSGAEKWLRFRQNGKLLPAAKFVARRHERLLSTVLNQR